MASRRAVDRLITQGVVAVDGRRAQLGQSIDAQTSIVTLNGKRVHPNAHASQLTLVLNKPAGVITTMSDERGRRTIAHLLPGSPRLFPVGRLDAETTGVLLCTTDGKLARLLTHPSSGVPKRYEVVARGIWSAQIARDLTALDHVQLSDGSHRFTVALTEGRNRQVRRMCAQAGLRVSSLTRTRFGPVRLGKLKIGCTRLLEPSETKELSKLLAEPVDK